MQAKQYLDLSVVIIAYNEEANIDRCLASVPDGAEVVVLDSGSTDRTQTICESRGARFFNRTFTNYADQKNAAIAHASRTWVLSLDADEVVDPELHKELIKVVTISPEKKEKAYRIRRQLVFMGKRLRYGKTIDYPVRLFQRGAGEFYGAVHEEFRLHEAHATARVSRGSLFHYSYADLSDYFLRFNRYTTQIAEKHQAAGKRAPFLAHVMRPWFEFLNRYFLRLGFLDGYPGYTYALISSLYTYVKYAKLRELEAKTTHG